MTEDPSSYADRPQRDVDLPRPGLAEGSAYEEAVEHEARADVDFEENELHAAGKTCARCGRAIRPEEDVRRTASGAYEHEFCGISVDPGPRAAGG